MPKLTKNLNLVKIQGNEYYDGDVENENLDKIDASINEINTGKVDIDGIDHETLKGRIDSDAQKVKVVENKLNRKDQMLLNPPLTTENHIQSVKDIEAGVASVVVPGLTLVNSWGIDLKSVYIPTGTGSILKPNVTDNLITAYNTFSDTKQSINVSVGDVIFIYTEVDQPTLYGRVGIQYSNNQNDYGTLLSPNNRKEAYGLVTATQDGVANPFTLANTLGNTTPTKPVNWQVLHMNALGIEDFTEAKMLELCRNGYFEGMQSRRGSLVKSVNENLVNNYFLCDDSGWALTEPFVTTVGQSYTFKNFHDESIGIRFEDNTGQIGYANPGGSYTFTSTEENNIFRLGILRNTNVTADVMVVEGTIIPISYIKNQYSDQQFQPLLGSVPNGERDEADLMNGVMNVRTNVGMDDKSYSIKDSDITFATLFANVAIYFVQLPDDIKMGEDANVNKYTLLSNGSLETIYSLSDDANQIGNYYFSDNKLRYIAAKTDTLTDVQNVLRDVEVAYQLAEPFQRKIEQVNPLATYAGYTQFVSEIGKIGPERATVAEHTAGTRYYYNVIDHPNTGGKDSTLNFRVESFDNIKYRGKSILNICDIESTYSHGDMRFSISNDNVELYNIDPYALDINYTTLETNGYKDVEVKYNVDLASAVSSNSQAISNVGEQVDRNTNTLTNQNLINLEFDVRLTAGGL